MPNNQASQGTVILITLLAILGVGVFFGFKEWSDTKNASENIPEKDIRKTPSSDRPIITLKNAFERYQAENSNVVFVDIRSPKSFETAHIPKSISSPLQTLSGFTPGEGESVIIVWGKEEESLLDGAYDILKKKSFPFLFLEENIETWSGMGFPILSFGDPNSFIDQSKVSYIEAEELKSLSLDTFLFLDVQEKADYDKAHVTGSFHTPLSKLENQSANIPRNKPIIVYGGNALASFQGAVRLFDLNIFSVRAFSGGVVDLEKSGFPIEKK